jgi:hypothetical protein
MPIAQFLQGQKFDAETTRVMSVAYEMVHVALGPDRGDVVNEIIAKRVIELAKGGVTNPDRVCEQTLAYFRHQRFVGPFRWSVRPYSPCVTAAAGRRPTRPPDHSERHDRASHSLSDGLCRLAQNSKQASL